jgi:hypothetical protein
MIILVTCVQGRYFHASRVYRKSIGACIAHTTGTAATVKVAAGGHDRCRPTMKRIAMDSIYQTQKMTRTRRRKPEGIRQLIFGLEIIY